MSFDVHPEMRPLIEARAKLPVAKTRDEDRANWSAYSRANNVPPPNDMTVENRTVEARDGHPIKIRIYTPAGGGRRAGLVYMHGGGFVKGDCDTSDTTGWGLAEGTGAVVVSVDYRLAPENPYPIPFNDCIDVLNDIVERPDAYGVDASRLGVVGDSAGGNLAAATALWARDNDGPALKVQGLIYPCLTDRLEATAYDRNAEAPGLTTASMESYWVAYLGAEKAGQSDDPHATPLVAEDLAGLPPAFVLTAEFDPLIDDGVAYAGKLMAAGVETGYFRADRMIHGFVRARVDGREAAKAFAALTNFLRAKLDD